MWWCEGNYNFRLGYTATGIFDIFGTFSQKVERRIKKIERAEFLVKYLPVIKGILSSFSFLYGKIGIFNTKQTTKNKLVIPSYTQ